MQLEFHQLDRRLEYLRVRRPDRQRQLLASLAASGQQTPIVVVAVAGFPLQNFESTEGEAHPKVWRNVNNGSPGAPAVSSDNTIVTTGNGGPQGNQFPQARFAIEGAHNTSHGYIGGSIGQPHFSFHDPFVFLLHSNVDRLWAKWQKTAGQAWRLDPNQVYGNDGSAGAITGNLEPWDGSTGLRPWAPPENQQVAKNCKHPSVVAPPLYDFGAMNSLTGDGATSVRGCFLAATREASYPAGGAHSKTGSGNYSLVQNRPGAHGQPDWRWCNKCQGMFFGGNPGSKCPAGGAHVKTGSGNYSMGNNAPAAHGQADWRWCNKCQGMFFGGNPGSKCPAGGAHSKTGSGNYRVVDSIPAAPGQANWRCCNKCQGMFFGGNPGSKCPAGGAHVKTGSGNYTVLHNLPPAPDQSNWRWCKKCQGLFFGGNPGSVCPKGGAHDSTGSGNYSLLQV